MMGDTREAPNWLERYGTYISLLLLSFIILGGAIFYLRWPRPSPIEIIEPTPSSVSTSGEVGVYVVGAVMNPGVYFLPQGSRVADALEVAGGPTEEADLVRVNLAKRVYDEERIYVPRLGEENPPLPPSSGSSSSQAGGKININTATAAELESLPGIGPVLAQRIVDYRKANGPFATIEDIKNVSGIGEGIFEEIKELIFVP
ncbi:MAG: helix-hairpin-helix domain-containing protein [Anaerolineae bacterium]|nr:helix-hairpin-helix domain-containing protein [Anaerolineae bacterium]